MKEMMLRLPVVEVSASDDLWLARFWQKNGRYIVRRDNGDVSVADVQMKPLGAGEARPDDERLASLYECFVGQPELLDPDDWVLAVDLENVKNACEADIKRMKEDLSEARERHEAEMAEQKARCEAVCKDTEEYCKNLIDQKERDVDYRIKTLNDGNEQKLAMRRMELEQEYEMKKMQLELETPKRFAQGEWVSGKTLTEIIRTLSGGKKED